jgi:hypothetical protein
MRLDLRSTGIVRNFTCSTNRTVCRQVAAEHERLSRCSSSQGLAIHRPTPAQALGDLAGALVPVHPDGAQAARPRTRHGGNARLEWQNHKTTTFKALHAPARNLTAEERATVLNDCRDQWPLVSLEEKEQWGLIHRSKALGRTLAPVVAAPAEAGPVLGLWQHVCEPCKLCPLPMDALVQCYHKRSAAHRRRLAINDQALLVTEPIECRSEFHDLASVFGCWAKAKNVCREILPIFSVQRLDTLTRMLSAWVDSLGAQEAGRATSLLWLRSRTPGEPRRVEHCILLIDPVYSPKMQFYARCCLQGHAGDSEFNMPPAFPVVVSINTRLSRMSKQFRALDICTSDELCQQLVTTGDDWDFIPLSWEFLPNDNLLDMKIVGHEEPFTLPVKAPKVKKTPWAEMPAEMFAEDPLAHGKATAQPTAAWLASGSSSSLGPPCDATPADGDEAAGGDEMLWDEDVDHFSGLAADVRYDMAQVLSEVLHSVDGACDGEGGALAQAPVPEFTDDLEVELPESDNEEEEALAAAPDVLPDTAEVEVMLAPPEGVIVLSPEQLADVATVSPGGYVSCAHGEWARMGTLGRITSWPQTLPESRRSISIHCHMHISCNSPAKRLLAVSNRQLLVWLFSGIPEPEGTRARKQELAREHKARWQPVLQHPVPSGASSSDAPFVSTAAV